MGQKKSRIPENKNSTRMQNGSQTLYSGPSDPRSQTYYNSDSSMYQSQQRGNKYQQQGLGPYVYYQDASSRDQPQARPSKGKRKSKNKKNDKKPKKSKNAPDSERSVSKKQKRKKEGEVHTAEQVHMVFGTKMKDRSHDTTSENASGGIHPRERNNLGYQDGSHALHSAGPSASFPEKRKEESNEEFKKMNELLSRKEEELHCIREKLSRKDEELHGVRQDLENTKKDINEQIRKYEGDLERKTEKIKQLEAEKNDLMNRLSSVAGARMNYNNPNITDLSDQNRPTKISERYAELYDNQWTDAFENLQKSHHLSDTKAIEVLLDVLYISFDVCKKTRAQKEALAKYITEYVCAAEGDMIVLEVMTILKGAKKKNISKMHKDYKKKVQEMLETKYSKWLQCIRPYIDGCVEICLLMNIQDPALELRGLMQCDKPLFDVAVFRPYTKSGNRIEHLVWPALCLYKHGPLLCKGVAQGMRDSSEGHKPSSTEDDASKEERKIEVSGQQEEPKVEPTKDRVPNGNNVKNEETNKLFEEKKRVEVSPTSKNSYRENNSDQSDKNIDRKSQTEYYKPDSLLKTGTNHSASTIQKKDETTQNRMIETAKF